LLARLRKKESADSVEEDVVVDVVDVSDADDSSDAPVGWKAKVLAKLPFLAKLIPRKKNDSNDRTDVGVKAPVSSVPQKQKIIRLIVGVGIAYLLFDTFMSGDEPVVEEPVVAVKRRPRRNRQATPVAESAKDKSETPAAESAKDKSETPAAESASDKSETPAAEKTSDIFAGEDLAPVETTSPESTDSMPPPDETISPSESAPENSSVDAPPPPTAAEDLMTSGGEATTNDQVIEPAPAGGEDMTDKILQDLEQKVRSEQETVAPVKGPYVSPPSYDYPGRGLVYNCVGKHWACVDGGSYQLCQKNYGALKEENRRKECFPDSVYETQQGCAWVQKQKVSNTPKTDFCN
jgi:hypothetical protein